MGCCVSKNGGDSKACRTARWRSTGIVALRDSKLKRVIAICAWESCPRNMSARKYMREKCYERFHLGFDYSKSFPDDVLELEKSVRTLDLTHNKLVDLPVEICKLINMQRLMLAENLIERLPMNIGKLQSLKIMILDGNQMTSLPDELGQLVRLERLSISGNLLTNLPDTIGSLRNLLLLNVSNNKLKSLPESIGSCFSLEELQADGNSVEEIPPTFCNLVNLKSLSLNNNKVNQIPPSLLKDCTSLQNISLHDNPIIMDQFQQMDGFLEFEARRKRKFDKQIDSNVMISSKGLDEGVDL